MIFYATHAVSRIFVRLHRVSFICYFFCGLVGDFGKMHGGGFRFLYMYKYSLPHISIYNRFQILITNNYGLYFYIVPISGFSSLSGGGDDALRLLIWFCKSATIVFNNETSNS